jgi:ethanolamine utilization protein EutJ
MSQLNPELSYLLDAADAAVESSPSVAPDERLRLGVDLGTAYVVLFVVDDAGVPVAGAYRFSSVVRDGVVVDFAGASALVRELRAELEGRLDRELVTAATTYPPGVPVTEVRATRYVLESVGLECTALVDEPTAANAVLRVRDGAVVDVGGGTTGIAVLRDGAVVYTADEPTGGTHLTLVIAGAHRVPFEQAEQMKTDRDRHRELFPIVRPVFERVGTIVADHLGAHEVERIYLVGGTSAFPGIAGVVEELTGVPTTVPGNPLFVTPLGVALHDDPGPGSRTPGALP